MAKTSVNKIKIQITNAFKKYLAVKKSASFSPVPKSLTSGKLYESFVLSKIVEELTVKESLKLKLVSGNKIYFKSSPGLIDRKYPYIQVFKDHSLFAEIWTDIEFLTLSYSWRSGYPQKGDYHELDIIMTEPNLHNRPPHNSIYLGIECKNTGYNKGLLKEILGIRRELSLLVEHNNTKFINWPNSSVPANPPSCLLVYSTDVNVNEYNSPGNVFGINFNYLPM